MQLHPVVLALSLAGFSCASAPTEQGPNSALSLPDRGVAAHRGASVTHPENTLAAIVEAVRLGAHQLEIDVRLTADGRLVLMHDATLERTTDVVARYPGREDRSVSSYTLAELQTLDAGSWKDREFEAERIPTLEEAFAQIPSDRWVNLDVKGERKLGAAVALEVLRLGRERQSILSLRGAAREGAREGANGQLLLNNMERQSTTSEYVERTIAGGFDFIQFFRGPFPSAGDIERLQAAGVRINYCCTNDPDQLRRWFAAGIEFPLVDDVAGAMEVAREAGITAP